MQPLDRPCVHDARLVELLLRFGIQPPDQPAAIRAEVLPVANLATAEFNRIHGVYDQLAPRARGLMYGFNHGRLSSLDAGSIFRRIPAPA